MRYATDATLKPRYDYATGLLSRWCLEALADDELSRALRGTRQVFLVVVASETRSQQKRLVVWLQRELGAGDIAGVMRPGVFAIVLPGADRASVSRTIDRARGAIGGGLNWGIAAFPDDGLTFETLLGHAAVDMSMACLAA